MKTSLFIIALISLIFATDTTYTTSEILDYIIQPTTLPGVTVSTRARAGYGTSEFLYEEPQTDLYGGVLVSFDIFSSADRRSQRGAQDQRRAEVLALLAEIKGHLNLSWQLKTQRAAYNERLEWHKERIDLNLEEHSTVYPIEKMLISLTSQIYKEQTEIQRAQLAIASYAGDDWEILFDLVKAWDKVL